MHPSLAATPLARWRPTLVVRLSLLALLFFADKIFLNGCVDFDRAEAAHGIGALVRVAQHCGFRFLVAWAVALG